MPSLKTSLCALAAILIGTMAMAIGESAKAESKFAFGQTFSCSYGKRAACLDAGDKCYSRHTCGFGGEMMCVDDCQRKLDDAANQLDNVADQYERLRQKHNSLVDCLTLASSWEDAEHCLLWSAAPLWDSAKGLFVANAAYADDFIDGALLANEAEGRRRGRFLRHLGWLGILVYLTGMVVSVAGGVALSFAGIFMLAKLNAPEWFTRVWLFIAFPLGIFGTGALLSALL